MGMKPEIKAQWLAALRSDEYTQSKGALKDGIGYCCLGVLCDLAEKAGVVEYVTIEIPDEDPENAPEERCGYIVKGSGDQYPANELLPEPVQVWSGLMDSNPMVKFSTGTDVVRVAVDIHESLADLNDEKGQDFKQIAQFIEEQIA